MADDKSSPLADKKKDGAKPTPPHEFEELDKAKAEALKQQALAALAAPKGEAIGLAGLMGLLNLAEMQYRHAIIAPEIIHQGEGKNFQAAFDQLLPRLSDIEHPTRVGLMVMEDSPTHLGIDKPVTHGQGVTAYCIAASRAITGKDYPVLLITRIPIEDYMGKTMVKIEPDSGKEIYGKDLAQGFLKATIFSKNSVNVVNVSLSGHNPYVNDHDSLLEGEKTLTGNFGSNTIFVVAAGNQPTQKNPNNKHFALYYHPGAVVVGAAHANPQSAPGGNGVVYSYSLTSYSAWNPDFVTVATPQDATYEKMEFTGVRKLPLHGTSCAAPQAAAIIAHLSRRFVASEENPKAVLSKEDVVLALKNTAEPLQDVIDDGIIYDLKTDPPGKIQGVRTAISISGHWVGNNFVSREAGNGIVNPNAAWALLEKMEKQVHAGYARVLKREDVSASLAPVAHTAVKGSDCKTLPKAGGVPAILYSYSLDVNDALVADKIRLDAEGKEMSRKSTSDLPVWRPRMYLVAPSGETVEILPSAGYNNYINLGAGAKRGPHDPCVMGNAVGMQGQAMKGKWTILCEEKLDKIHIDFQHAMQPEHVAVQITPDIEIKKRSLYRVADYSYIKLPELERWITKDSPALNYDFSQTGFPPHFMDIRTAMAAEKDKEHALKLIESRYGNFKDKAALIEAVREGDGQKVLDILIPPETRFSAMERFAATESKESLIFLAKHGFATAKEQGVAPGVNPTTAFTEMVRQRGMNIEAEVVQAFIDAGAPLKARDRYGRTALHYMHHDNIRKLLIDTDLNGPPGTRLFEMRDNDGKTYLEYRSIGMKDEKRITAQISASQPADWDNIQVPLEGMQVLIKSATIKRK